MKSISQVLEQTKGLKRPKNISQEFQHFGIYLAEELSDPDHYSLYIKLSKNNSRGLLEEALTYAKGYTTARSKAKIFMWRLKQLKQIKVPGQKILQYKDSVVTPASTPQKIVKH